MSHEDSNVDKLKEQGKSPRKLPIPFDNNEEYEAYVLEVEQEKNRKEPCECRICTTARAKLNEPHWKTRKILGRPKRSQEKDDICPKCWSKDEPGHNYSKGQKIRNIAEGVSPHSMGLMPLIG